MQVKYRRKQTEHNHKEIVKDYNAGMKIKDIIEKHKVSKAGIYYILQKARG